MDYNHLLRKSSTTSHTGTDFRPEDSEHEFTSLIHSLQHHQTHCVELLSHLTPACPVVRTLYDISPIATPENRLYDFQQIVKQIHTVIRDGSDENLQYCGLLLLQRTFVDAVLEISVNLADLIQREMKLDHNIEDQVYYIDAMNFHNRILSEVLEVSSMFVGKGHFSKLGFSSAALNHAIARFGALALGLSRQLLSRPIIFHEKRVWGNNVKGRCVGYLCYFFFTGVDEANRRLALISSSGESTALTHLTTLHEMRRFYDELVNASLFEKTSQSIHEESFRPIGSAFYGEDRSHLLVDEDMSLWGSLLPPVYIPQYVEVDVYIIKMQNTYEPIGITITYSSVT